MKTLIITLIALISFVSVATANNTEKEVSKSTTTITTTVEDTQAYGWSVDMYKPISVRTYFFACKKANKATTYKDFVADFKTGNVPTVAGYKVEDGKIFKGRLVVWNYTEKGIEASKARFPNATHIYKF